MRRLLSVLLAAVIVFAGFSADGFDVRAMSSELTLGELNTVTLDGVETVSLEFTPTTTDYYVLKSFSNFDLICRVYNNSTSEEVAYNDDGGERRDFCVKAKLYEGVTYTYEIEAYSFVSGDFNVRLDKSAYVTDIKIVTMPHNSTYLKGYVEDYFSYDGMELMLTFSDESEIIYKCSEDYMWENFDMTVDVESAETTGKVSVKIDEATCDIPITILNKNIKNIEVIDDNFAPLEEAVNGMWSYDEDYNDCFFYYYDTYDMGLKVNYSDGSSDIIESLADSLFGVYYVYADDNQVESQWSVGGNKNTVTVEFLDFTAKYNVKIIENPVASITINTAPTRQYVYGDLNYGDMFYGDYFFYPEDLEGLEFTVNFKNSSKKTYTYNNINKNDFTIDGYAIFIDYDFFATPGKIPVTLNYRGCTAEYKVVLKQSEVSKVDIIKAPTVSKLKNGYFSADYIGTQFKISYTNGTTKNVTVSNSNSTYIYEPDLGNVGVDVAVDGYTARLYTEYGYEDDCSTVLSFLGASCTKENLVSFENVDFKSVKVTEFNTNGELTVSTTLQDGTQKELKLKPTTKLSQDYGDLLENTFIASTEFGVCEYYYSMYENNIGVFELELFGYYFDFELPAVKGDFNFSGKVDLQDVVMLSQYTAGWEITCDGSAMNVNGDSQTNLSDVVHLAQFVAGWQNVELK